MQNDERFPRELFTRDDAAGLQRALEQPPQPDLETLLGLLDCVERKPHTTACLLQELRRRYTPEEIETSRRLRREKELGLLDWDTDDWSAQFRWENRGTSCRILEYLGGDEEILIPEQIDGRLVQEISKLFFLRAAPVCRLLVPEGVRTGTVQPWEACELFGKAIHIPEIVHLERKLPLPHFEPPIALPFCGVLPAETVAFGRYAYDRDGASAPIIWQVLRQEADRALLVSKQILELLPYHHNRSAVLWADCDLRRWLNEPFLQAAFLAEEQARLLPVTLSSEPNPVFRTRNNCETQDRVFLLSPSEWTSYPNRLEASAEKTPWAARNDGIISHPFCPVWMRMPGLNTQYAVISSEAAKPDYQGRLVPDLSTGVQPAVWIRV